MRDQSRRDAWERPGDTWLIELLPERCERLRETSDDMAEFLVENFDLADISHRETRRTIDRSPPGKRIRPEGAKRPNHRALFHRATDTPHIGGENLVADVALRVPRRSPIDRHGIRGMEPLAIDVEGSDDDRLFVIEAAGGSVRGVRDADRWAARRSQMKNSLEMVSSGSRDTNDVTGPLPVHESALSTPSLVSLRNFEATMPPEQSASSRPEEIPSSPSSRGVILFNRGTKCLVRLLVCLHSLRKWWQGPVTVFVDGAHPEAFLESLKLFDAVAARSDNPVSGAYIRKVEVCFETPYDRTLWLDSDTIVCGPIDAMFDALDQHDVVTPHFAGWWSHGRRIRKRIEQYRGKCPDEWLATALEPHPAVNMGIFAFRRGVSFLQPWLELSRKGDHKEVTLPEEIAFQILYPRFPVGIVPIRFGASVKHDPGTDDIRIVHYHGQKHVHDFPLCAHWKRDFRELLDAGTTRLGDLLHLADRRLKRHLGIVDHVTVVTACDAKYVEKLRLTFPTWVRRKQIQRSPILVFVHGIPLEDRRLDFLRLPSVRLMAWDFPVDNQRERMLSAFVFGAAQHVETKWWMKLDADTFAVDDRPLIDESMKPYAFYGHKWGRSRVEHIAALDRWAGAHPRLRTPPLFDASRVAGDKFLFPRTQSFAQLEATWFTRLCAKLAGARLPVPSHDTFGFYVADRLGHPIGRSNFKARHGVGHSGRLSRLREIADA